MKGIKMTKKQYIHRLKIRERQFAKVWGKIVRDTNLYIDSNKDNLHSYDVDKKIEELTDYLCLSGSWLTDRLNGKVGITSSDKYRGSLTKKIRKALGYTY